MFPFESVQGRQRRFDVGGKSAIAPIATKMLRRDERRKGPLSDIRIVERVTVFSGEVLEIRPALR